MSTISSPQPSPSAHRSSQACENCRVRKSRCLPTGKPGICQRCAKSNLKCVFLTKTAPKPTGPRVLRELQPAQQPEADILPSLFAARNDPASEQSFEVFHREMFDQHFPQYMAPTEEPKAPTTTHDDDILQACRVTPSQAKTCMEAYAAVNKYTPYVQLPASWTVESMLTTRPVQSLAIITVMSSGVAQRSLDVRFRQILGDRTLVRREHATLDTLQGALLYAARCPFYLNPRKTGLYHIEQTIGNLVRDLRLDVACASADERRAYLGACYLSTALAMPPRRPPSLEFTEAGRTAACAVARAQESDLDGYLLALVNAQQIMEDSRKAILMDDGMRRNLLMQVQLMDSKDEDMTGYLETLKKFTFMKIYTTSLAQLSPLSCLTNQAKVSIKTVLEAFIDLDVAICKALPSVEWTRLVNVVVCIFTLLQASSPHDQPDLDQFGPHLEALHLRFTALHSNNESDGDGDGADNTAQKLELFGLWAAVLGVVREKYARMIEEGSLISMASMCPALGSAFRQTEYWDFVQQGANNARLQDTANPEILDYPTPGESRTDSST